MINNAQCNQEEIKHGTFGSNSSVDFSQNIDSDFSIFGNDLLSLNFS